MIRRPAKASPSARSVADGVSDHAKNFEIVRGDSYIGQRALRWDLILVPDGTVINSDKFTLAIVDRSLRPVTELEGTLTQEVIDDELWTHLVCAIPHAVSASLSGTYRYGCRSVLDNDVHTLARGFIQSGMAYVTDNPDVAAPW